MPARTARRCRRPAICRYRRKLARAGVKDMVRISDARMSGTAYGTIVLHTAPEAAVGGPLAVGAQRRSRIALSVSRKRLDLLVDDSEIKRRLMSWTPPAKPTRGYAALYRNSVLQAPAGCDFDFLVGRRAESR